MASRSVISDDMSETLTSPSTSGVGSSPETAVTSMSSAAPEIVYDFVPPSPGAATLVQSQTNPDNVEDEERRVGGWPQVAYEMTKRPEFESFPRFQELNIKTLLYYQVELAFLQRKLVFIERIDANKRGFEESEFKNRAWKMAKRSHDEGANSKSDKQWKLVLKIRKLLKEYNEALLQHANISALPSPEPCNAESFRVWLKRAAHGSYCIDGDGCDAWGNLYAPEEEDKGLGERSLGLLRSMIFWWRKDTKKAGAQKKTDLVVTRPRPTTDGIARWIIKECIPFYHACRNKLKEKPKADEEKSSNGYSPDTFERYSEQTILRFTSAVATVVACVLPTLAIGILTTAETVVQKLLYIGGFTALFAIGLMILTDPDTSRVQVFTATAAFSAVLVVFVQK